MLRHYGAQATFFWLGEKVISQGNSLDPKPMYEQGHRIELHGHTHTNPWRISRKVWVEDVKRGLRILSEWLSEKPRYYRPPYGRYRFMDKSWGLRVVLWDLMPPDYRTQKGWAAPAVRALKPGDIVVLHERKEAEWLEWEAFLSGAAQKGLRASALP